MTSLPSFSVPTFAVRQRVFGLLYPGQFNRWSLSWIGSINPHHEQEIANIGGKTLRRSQGEGKSAIYTSLPPQAKLLSEVIQSD